MFNLEADNQDAWINNLPPPPLLIPCILKDELIFSYINRLKENNDLDEYNLKFLIRKHYASLSHPCDKFLFLDCIASLVNQNLDDFIKDHTMSPESHTFKSLYENHKINPYSICFIFKRSPKFCPNCCLEEYAKLGISYWHRWHQIRGVYMCELHDEPLLIGTGLTPFDNQPHRLLKTHAYQNQNINFGKNHPEITKYLFLTKEFLRNKHCINFLDLIDKLVEKDLEINGHPLTKHNKKPLSRLIIRNYPKQWLSDHYPFFNRLNPSKTTIYLDAIIKLRRYDGPLISYLIYFAYLFDVSEILDRNYLLHSD